MIDTITLSNEDLKILTSTPERVKVIWEQYAQLREEFPSFDAFEAYVRALQAGHTHTIHGGGVTTMADPSTVKGKG